MIDISALYKQLRPLGVNSIIHDKHGVMVFLVVKKDDHSYEFDFDIKTTNAQAFEVITETIA